MKSLLTLLAVAASLACTTLHAQTPAPAAPAPAPASTPQALIQQLQAIRDANVKLLEQQTKTLAELDEMVKTAQSIKAFAKRS